MFNSFGQIYRFTTFGESHGEGVGVVIDGCPAGLKLDLDFMRAELDRRRPGQSRITTQRKETDAFQLLSGHVDLQTTGTPLCFWVANQNQRPDDYSHIENTFRPSHADYTYHAKYGTRDHRGGGRASARETVGRVIAGAVAKLFLSKNSNIKIAAWVHAIHNIEISENLDNFDLEGKYARLTACPDEKTAKLMYARIDEARKSGDSLGGIMSCQVLGMPTGLGEPVYDKLEARLASAMLSIPATKGFEIGSGLVGTRMKGSEHNDAFYSDEQGKTRTRSNHSGGIQGGISNGEDLAFKVAFKPTATIMRDQESVDSEGKSVVLKGKGRHDPCVLPRAVPIVEAMTAVVLMDFMLLNRTRRV